MRHNQANTIDQQRLPTSEVVMLDWYEDLEAVISGQMWLYMQQGKAAKAARIISKLRMRLRGKR